MNDYEKAIAELREQANVEREMCQRSARRLEAIEAKIEGMEQAKQILGYATPEQFAAIKERRQRRDIVALVREHIGPLPTKLDPAQLAAQLDCSKKQIEQALAKIRDNGEVVQ